MSDNEKLLIDFFKTENLKIIHIVLKNLLNADNISEIDGADSNEKKEKIKMLLTTIEEGVACFGRASEIMSARNYGTRDKIVAELYHRPCTTIVSQHADHSDIPMVHPDGGGRFIHRCHAYDGNLDYFECETCGKIFKI